MFFFFEMFAEYVGAHFFVMFSLFTTYVMVIIISMQCLRNIFLTIQNTLNKLQIIFQ